MAIPNYPTWADIYMSNAQVPSREVYPPSEYPAWIDAPWGLEVARDCIIPQDAAGAASAPLLNGAMGEADGDTVASPTFALPFNEPMGIDAYNHTMVPSSISMNPVDWVQEGQGNLLVHEPAQSANVNTTVVRRTIGTPAITSSADRRRKYPRKHVCHICGNKFTSKANRDRHVRAHYGIKPFVCPCGIAFTARADLTRHRKGSRCPVPGLVE